jgi:hypothetical protein
LGTQLQFQFVIGFLKLFFGGREIQRAFQQALTRKILTLFAKVMTFSFFPFGHMLSATTIAAESTQNCPKLPNFVKICPKTTSLRNFEIPPKIEILAFSKKIKIYVEDAPKHVLTIWIFNTTIFCKPFLLSKNHLCM